MAAGRADPNEAGFLRGGRGVKRSNAYARALPEYGSMPKAVLAAVAWSLACRLDGDGRERDAILHEWRVLHQNGIVSQRPPGP